jgi:hypothetical protein
LKRNGHGSEMEWMWIWKWKWRLLVHVTTKWTSNT